MVITKNSTRYQLFLRTRIVLLLLFVVCAGAQVNAQTFQSTSSYPMTQHASQAVDASVAGSYRAYESTIYEPFTAASPSSNSSNAPAGITGRKNTTINPGNEGEWGENSDGGKQENSYPIGEPWIMLLFAAAGAVVVYMKQRKKAEA